MRIRKAPTEKLEEGKYYARFVTNKVIHVIRIDKIDLLYDYLLVFSKYSLRNIAMDTEEQFNKISSYETISNMSTYKYHLILNKIR